MWSFVDFVRELVNALPPCSSNETRSSADIEAGDGTTSVCVIAGALLNACQALLEKGIHPTQISESFMAALDKVSLTLHSSNGLFLYLDSFGRHSTSFPLLSVKCFQRL